MAHQTLPDKETQGGLSIKQLREKIGFYKYQNNDTALIYALELTRQNEGTSDLREKLENVGLIARVYMHLEYYDLALQLYNDIFTEIEESGDKEMLAESMHYLALLYSYMSDFERSLTLFNKSLKLRDRQNELAVLHTLHGLGDDYRFIGKVDSSYYYLNQAYPMIRRIDNKELNGQVALAFVETLIKMDSLPRARVVLSFVVDSLKYGNDSQLAYGYVLGVQGLLLAKEGDFKNSISKLMEAIEIGQSMHYNYGVITCYRWLLPILEQAENYELAYHHSKIFKHYELARFQTGQDKHVKQLEIMHQTKQKEQALKFQNEQLAKNKMVIIFLTCLIVLGVFLIITIYRNSRIRQKLAIKLHERNDKIELLMRELHHRVKNNLQVISSLLGLQSMKMEEGLAKQAVEEGKSRVRAMAIIHQKLYRKEDLTGINFDEYVMTLVNELKNTYSPNTEIVLDICIPAKSLDIDTTMPLGLIINEIVSNSFKYAFSDIDKPILKIRLLEEHDTLKLTVSDNGLGLSKDFNLDAATSFGMKLIKMLTRQLNGTLNIRNAEGLQYELVFKLVKV